MRSVEKAPPRAGDPTPEAVLIVRLSALGDVLHCLPALDALRQLWPEARIDWVCESLGTSVIRGHPAVDTLIELPRKRWTRELRHPLRWIGIAREARRVTRRLRERRYDLVIDFQGNLRARAVSLLCRRRGRISHHKSELPEHRWLFPGPGPRTPFGRGHRVERALHITRALGWSGPAPAGRLPDYDEERTRLRAAVGDADWSSTVLLHPFTSAFGQFKEWRPRCFVELARRLSGSGLHVLVSAAPGERERARAIVEATDDRASLAPPTASARELAALLSLVEVVVAADTGPLHLAALAGTGVVALFGPKDPSVYGPWSTRARVLRGEVPCSPCTLRRCEHSVCMEAISVDQVQDAVESLLPSAPA